MSAPVSAVPALPSADDPVQQDWSPVEHEMAEVNDTDNDSTDSNDAQLPQPQSQAHVKRYSPPKPDANTFETQEAFLESLEPMKIEDVEEDNRKCPICWKLFGEDPDPGFDNSEVPVQLRCKHIFGDKCLNSVFAVRKGCGITLQPLQFSPGRKGCLLGEMLLRYHQQHGSNFRSEVEMFENLLQHQRHHSGEQRYFDVYWAGIIHMILHQHPNLLNITFMENAVIMDHYVKNPPKNTVKPEPIPPQYLNGTYPPQNIYGTGMSSTLAGTPSYPVTHISSTVQPHTMPSGASHQAALQSNIHTYQNASSLPPSFGYNLPPQTPHPESWHIALANETNLDKLTALQKQFSHTKNATVGTSFGQKVNALKLQAAKEEQFRKEEQIVREAVERRTRDRNTLLARKLTDILSQYKAYKSSLNPGVGSSQLDVADILPPQSQVKAPDQILIKVNIHNYNMEDTSHVIPPPWGHASLDEDEMDEETTGHEIARSTLIVKRTYCNNCIEEITATAATPSKLTWRPLDKTPDDCPLCHKVLFKRSSD